ncbi:hypothetical protein AB0C74_39745 [Spirillospora sp. NPDC048832]
MKTRRRSTIEQGNMLARLRAGGGTGPDPRFREVLRERLVAAAGDRDEECRNRRREEGRGEAVD